MEHQNGSVAVPSGSRANPCRKTSIRFPSGSYIQGGSLDYPMPKPGKFQNREPHQTPPWVFNERQASTVMAITSVPRVIVPLWSWSRPTYLTLVEAPPFPNSPPTDSPPRGALHHLFETVEKNPRGARESRGSRGVAFFLSPESPCSSFFFFAGSTNTPEFMDVSHFLFGGAISVVSKPVYFVRPTRSGSEFGHC